MVRAPPHAPSRAPLAPGTTRASSTLAWLNGVGVVVWENVFGSWVPWSAANQRLLRQMRPVYRHLGDLFSDGTWEPLVETSAVGVNASCWELDDLRLWTVANATGQAVQGPLVPVEARAGESYWDLFSGGPARLDRLADGVALGGDIGPGGVAAFAAAAGPLPRGGCAGLIERSPAGRQATAPPPRSTAGPSSGPGRTGGLGRVSRRLARATAGHGGLRPGPAPTAPPLPAAGVRPGRPGPDRRRRRPRSSPDRGGGPRRRPRAVRTRPGPGHQRRVHRFLAATGYRPRHGDNFLRHWPGDGEPGRDRGRRRHSSPSR